MRPVAKRLYQFGSGSDFSCSGKALSFGGIIISSNASSAAIVLRCLDWSFGSPTRECYMSEKVSEAISWC